MKKAILGVLLLAVLANSAVTQNSIIGNWSLERPQTAEKILALEKGILNLTKDWKFTENGVYNVNYPSYGANKVDLKYKLKVSIDGEYRLEGEGLRKYIKNFAGEIIEGSANDEAVAKNSIKDIEKLIKEDAKKPFPISHVSETDMNLQGVNGNPDFKYSKPKKLPVSKLTRDTVPFFPPEGWRFPENAKELANFPVRLKNDKISNNLFTVVKADFNGDGLPDAVAYLMNAETEQIALFINMSQGDGSYELKPYGSADKGTIIENGIMLASAGEHVNPVNKTTIILQHPAFIEIIFDTTAYLIYWDSKSNDWVKVPVGKKL